MSQTTYNLVQGIAVPGLVADGRPHAEFTGRFPASEIIPPGRFCEVVAGKVRLAQGTGQDSATEAGISVYKAMLEPQTGGEYQIGDLVPLLRKGAIWVEIAATSGSITELEDAHYSHSSTITTNRGKFTDEAPAATAGTEISRVIGKFLGANATATLARVAIDLP